MYFIIMHACMQVVSEGFEDAFKVLSTVLKPVCTVIEDVTSWFSPIADHLKDVTNVFEDVHSVLHKVEDAFAPIKWALDAVKCIFDKVIGPVIHWIMHVS